MSRNTSPAGLVSFLIIFGGMIGYCLAGAATGDLYLPGKSGHGGHLHGAPAWGITAFFSFAAMGVGIREFSSVPTRWRGRLEILSYLAGIAAMVIGYRA